MAYIGIITLKNGEAACGDYFYADGKCMKVGQGAYVPDDQLEIHLNTGLVHKVSAEKVSTVVNADEAPRPGRKPSGASE